MSTRAAEPHFYPLCDLFSIYKHASNINRIDVKKTFGIGKSILKNADFNLLVVYFPWDVQKSGCLPENRALRSILELKVRFRGSIVEKKVNNFAIWCFLEPENVNFGRLL